jgi:hypothetical protein
VFCVQRAVVGRGSFRIQHFNMNNILAPCLVAAACLVVVGCSGGDSRPIPVRGTVLFRDGAVPRGEIAVIRLEPMAAGGRPAIGDIHEDGSFELSTIGGTKGVLPGKYKVTLKVSKTYRPPHVSVVAKKYDQAETSDIDVEVSETSPKSLDLKVDRE